jgi:hypothetical protein
MFHRHYLASLLVVLGVCQTARAQEVHTNPQNGQQYRVTGRQLVSRPVTETRVVENQYTVHTPRTITEYQPSSRTVYSPVTEYQWEPYMANRWNPFTSPSVQYRYVPRTRWEMRTEQVHIPVTRQELVAEQRISRTPITTQRFVTEEQVTAVAVNGGDPFGSNTAVAAKPQIGGTQLSNDSPRQAASGGMWGGIK